MYSNQRLCVLLVFQLLEQLAPHVRDNDPFIFVPVRLEQCIVEGAYERLLLDEKTVPSILYTPFMKILMCSIR